VTGVLEADPEHPGDPLKCAIVKKLSETAPNPPELASSAFGYRGISVDRWGTIQGNKGLYGAIARYRFEAENNNEDIDGSLNLNVRMVNNQGHFAGIGGTTSPTGDAAKIHTLHYNQNPQTSRFDTGADMSIPRNDKKTIVCQISPAGAAQLPVNLVLTAGGIT
jgi:hypothetical protein